MTSLWPMSTYRSKIRTGLFHRTQLLFVSLVQWRFKQRRTGLKDGRLPFTCTMNRAFQTKWGRNVHHSTQCYNWRYFEYAIHCMLCNIHARFKGINQRDTWGVHLGNKLKLFVNSLSQSSSFLKPCNNKWLDIRNIICLISCEINFHRWVSLVYHIRKAW